MLAERHFHFHSVVEGRLRTILQPGHNYGKKVKVPLRRVRGGSGVCVGGGGGVFDLDLIRCEPRTHGNESHYLIEPYP